MKNTLFVVIIAVAFGFSCQKTVLGQSLHQKPRTAVHHYTGYRTELYFGRSIPGGGRVSDDEWEEFLLDVVTARFPRGFTVVDATGQYMQEDDEVIKEPTKILVIFYPSIERSSSRRKVEEIRRAYVKQFKQESVLWLDFRTPVDVI